MPYAQAEDVMTRVNSTSSQGIQFNFSDHFLPSPSLRPSLPSISIPSYSTSSVVRIDDRGPLRSLIRAVSQNRLLRSASSESQNSENSERSDDTISSPRRVSCALVRRSRLSNEAAINHSTSQSIDLFDLLDDDVDPIVIVPSPNTSAHPDVSGVHQLLARTQAAVASVRAIVCPSRVLAKSKSCRNLFQSFKTKSRRKLQVQPHL